MEKGALIFKLAWEPVQFYSLFCLPRLKSSSYCPTGSCSSFDAGGHWPFPLLRMMSNYKLCRVHKHFQTPPPTATGSRNGGTPGTERHLDQLSMDHPSLPAMPGQNLEKEPDTVLPVKKRF